MNLYEKDYDCKTIEKETKEKEIKKKARKEYGDKYCMYEE